MFACLYINEHNFRFEPSVVRVKGNWYVIHLIIFLNSNTCYVYYKISSMVRLLSTIFIMLINVKMPTSVGILTFISSINTTCGRRFQSKK